VSASGFITLRKILSFSSVVEFVTGLALIAAPALVARLLLGADIAGIAIALARFLGVGLLGLGLACWRRKASTASDASAFRGMLVYNSLVALYLGYLGFVGHAGGALLWPAVALHAAVAVALVWACRAENSSVANETTLRR
jgi:hypothetical protein